MSVTQTIEDLKTLRLPGIAEAFQEQSSSALYHDLPFEQRLGMLVDRELLRRKNSRLQRAIREATLRQAAAPEDVDFSIRRELSKSQFLELCQSAWLEQHRCLLVTGSTGLGKTFLANALCHNACRLGFAAKYLRTQTLLSDLQVARAEGSVSSYITRLLRFDLLVLDEWLRDPLTAAQARDVHDIVDERYQRCSTMLVSQLPPEQWHDNILDPTIADAILDRLLHGALRIKLAGESVRKLQAESQAAAGLNSGASLRSDSKNKSSGKKITHPEMSE